MAIASRRPSKEPSERRSSKMAFRTGACWATQSILRCPSGARVGSFTMDSSIMAPAPVCPTSLTGLSYAQFTGQGDGLPLSSMLLEYVRQRLRAVGHDYIRPEVEQAAHLTGVVYRPHVHPHAPRVCRLHKARRGQRDPPVFDGHLERVVGGAHQAFQAQFTQKIERSRLQPGGPSGDLTSRDLAKASHDRMIAGDDERPPLGAGAPYDPQDGFLHARLSLFYIHIYTGLRKLLADLG